MLLLKCDQIRYKLTTWYIFCSVMIYRIHQRWQLSPHPYPAPNYDSNATTDGISSTGLVVRGSNAERMDPGLNPLQFTYPFKGGGLRTLSWPLKMECRCPSGRGLENGHARNSSPEKKGLLPLKKKGRNARFCDFTLTSKETGATNMGYGVRLHWTSKHWHQQ